MQWYCDGISQACNKYISLALCVLSIILNSVLVTPRSYNWSWSLAATSDQFGACLCADEWRLFWGNWKSKFCISNLFKSSLSGLWFKHCGIFGPLSLTARSWGEPSPPPKVRVPRLRHRPRALLGIVPISRNSEAKTFVPQNRFMYKSFCQWHSDQCYLRNIILLPSHYFQAALINHSGSSGKQCYYVQMPST